MADNLPPLPPGFALDQGQQHPPLPPGFTLDGAPRAAVQPHQSAPQGLGDQIKSYAGGIEQGLYALPQGALKLGARATDAMGLTHGGYDTLNKEFQDASQMATPQQKNNMYQGGKFLGSMASTAPLMAAGPALGGAMTGATLSDAKDAKGLAVDTGLGGLGGKTGDLLAKGAAKVISPVVSKYAKALMDEGVRLTPGQLLGGAVHKFEDKLSSIPFLGDMISNARIRGLQDFNRAAIDRSLAPIGQKLPEGLVGRDAVEHASQALSDNYNKLLGQATFKADPTYTANVSNLTNLAKNIPQYGEKPLQDFIATNITPRLSKAGTMSGKEFKEADELLGKEIADYAPGAGNDRKLASAFRQLQAELKDGLSRTNPAIRKELDDTDAGFANLVRVQNAAGRSSAAGVDPGTFSPAQLAAAIRGTDNSARKNAVARGNALMQDLSDAGKMVLPSQVPDSGTPGRIGAMLLAGGTAGHMIAPAAAAPIAALTGAYTKPGVKALEYALARRPASAPALAAALRKNSALAAAPAAVGATTLAQQLMGQQ